MQAPARKRIYRGAPAPRRVRPFSGYAECPGCKNVTKVASGRINVHEALPGLRCENSRTLLATA